MVPSAAQILPRVPRSLSPTATEIFTARMPWERLRDCELVEKLLAAEPVVLVNDFLLYY